MYLVLGLLFSNLSSVYYKAVRRADCEEILLWSFNNGYKLLYIRLHLFFQSEGSIKLITVQFKNWLFLAYHSLLKHQGHSLFFGLSYLFCIFLQKAAVHVTEKTPLCSNVLIYQWDVVYWNRNVYIHSMYEYIYFLSRNIIFYLQHFVSCVFSLSCLIRRKRRSIQTSLLLLQENKTRVVVFENQSSKRKKLFKLLKKILSPSSFRAKTCKYLYFLWDIFLHDIIHPNF